MKGIFFLVALALADKVVSENLTVQTTNGPITGHLAPDVEGVREFLGIPYAEPPVGDLRFAPSERYTGQKPYEASTFSDDCLFSQAPPYDFPEKTPQFDQIVAAFVGQNDNVQSEDCLSLNIWSNAGPKKPVIVFFHGGRFAAGDTNTPFLTGKYFAEAQDVVVVTVNYRTNIFGFPGAPGETQNLGLLDQRLSVEWLRDNVESFGGDPNRIIISGQSSGGVAVDLWSYHWADEPIVAGLISYSGTVFSFPVNSEEVASRHWYNASTLLGCGSSGDVMPCMRNKSAIDVKDAMAEIPPPPSSDPARSEPPFQPMPDGETVLDDYTELSAQGKFAPIPYLLGHNNDEGGFYNISVTDKGGSLTDEEWEQFVHDAFNCPTSQEATNRATHGVPVWRYRYHADWDNTRLYPTSGAYHGVDLHMIFGASADVSGLPESPEQTKLKQTMQAAWAAFAADPEEGLTKMGWPTFDPEGETLIQLGLDNNPEVIFTDPSVYDDTCTL